MIASFAHRDFRSVPSNAGHLPRLGADAAGHLMAACSATSNGFAGQLSPVRLTAANPVVS